MQQVSLWYTVVFQIDSILQRIVTNKRSMLLILNNYVSRNLEVGLGRALSRLGLFRQAREVPLSPLEYARRLDLADDLDVEDA